ncbi:MAG: major capsid protein [Microviridae sp.]|nr:MAG: major capsid protein [Microviridae sp.]
MSKLFNQVSFSKPKRNLFDLSHEKKLSMKFGDLVPVLLQEVVPGDSFNVNTESLLRLAPMVAPVMHRCNAYIHYFFVPNRLVWEGWETFITGGEDGKQTASTPECYLFGDDYTLLNKGTLADYMGIPTAPQSTISTATGISALPFRAYQLIYNEYYRDQNLVQKVPLLKTSGQLTEGEKIAVMTLRRRAYEKDYFTSCLPWSQRGDEVLLPNDIVSSTTEATEAFTIPGGGVPANAPLSIDAGKVSNGTTYVNLQTADQVQITINDLRRSARLQEFLEKTARGGSRLTEVIRSFFGVTSSDARLQRPEFLGGGKQPITISEVLSTFNNETVPGGEMYGHGISVGNTNRFKKFFEEHGFIIGIMSVLPRTAYQQGIPKQFMRFDKFDYYWPTFAQLGEEEVKNYELFHDYTSVPDDTEFGYQSRYASYKFAQSTVHGDFKDSLSHWHMGRIFFNKPMLNELFITCIPNSTTINRVFADTTDNDKIYVQLYNNVKAMRPMPYFNNPIL